MGNSSRIKKSVKDSSVRHSQKDWTSVTERNLIKIAIQGEQYDLAMVELWNRYKKRLYLFVKYRINFHKPLDENQEKFYIEDIIQGAFLDVLENLTVYNPQYEVSTWIYNVTNKHIVRFIRESQKYAGRTSGFDDLPEGRQFQSNTDNPETLNELKEFEQIVLLFVQSLKQAADKEVFLLYLQNLHTKNIADYVKTTQDAVRARLNRVIKRFKSFLQKKYPEYLQANVLSQIKNLQIRDV